MYYNITGDKEVVPSGRFKITHGEGGLCYGITNKGNSKPPPRGLSLGWSYAAVKNLKAFLRSVLISKLDGVAYEFTATFRDCPSSPEAMHRVRRAFLKRLQRRQLLRYIWVCEFQKRGVPHFHFILYFNSERDKKALLDAWLIVAREYNVKEVGLSCQKIHNLRGYYDYMSKHTARGIKHYQRQKHNMPKEWRGRQPKMWGYSLAESWPVGENVDITDLPLFARFRRAVRQQEIARVRGVIVAAVGSHFAHWSLPRAKRKQKMITTGILNLHSQKSGRSLVAAVKEFLGSWGQVVFMRGLHKHTVPKSVYAHHKNVGKPIPKIWLKEYSKRRGGSLFCNNSASLVKSAKSSAPDFVIQVKHFQTSFGIMDNAASSMEKKQ